MEYEIFEEDQGWAYRVGGIYQPYHPEKDGFIPMTQAEAEQCACIVHERLCLLVE